MRYKNFIFLFSFLNCLLLAPSLVGVERVKKSIEWELWTDEQIKKDFAPYEASGITLEMLDQTIAWNSEWLDEAYPNLNEGMVRVRVVDSQIYQTRHKTFLHWGITALVVLEEIIKRYPLPDVDFIYLDQDGPLPPDGNLSVAFMGPDGSMPLGPILAGTKRDEFNNVILYHDCLSPVDLREEDTEMPLLAYSWAHEIEAVEKGGIKYPWEKKLPKLFWRGRATDRIYTDQDYVKSPRVGLVLQSQQLPDLIDAAFTGWWKNTLLSSIPEFPELQSFARTEDHLLYKYQVCVDGAAGQFPGFAWRLLSNCLVFKIKSPVKLWFDAGLASEFHYIPIEHDLSNLANRLIWAQEHDDEARSIAENGRKFAQENIMPDDLILYCYKVLLKYASLQKFQPIIPTLSKDSEFEFVSSPLTEVESIRKKRAILKLIQKSGVWQNQPPEFLSNRKARMPAQSKPNS